MRQRRAAAVVAAVLLGVPSGVQATVGTGVSASPIVLAQPAVPGHVYDLPRLYLVNTGTELAHYTLRVRRYTASRDRDVPSSWITFGGTDIVLAAGKGTTVAVRLSVPAGAASGDYASNIVAGTVTPGHTGTSLGAQAATDLRFRVVSGQSGFTWPLPPAVTWLLTAAAAIPLLLALAWRLGLRVQVARRN